MEKGPSQSMEALLAQDPPPWPWRRSLEVASGILRALDSRHARGLAYPGLHPRDIFVREEVSEGARATRHVELSEPPPTGANGLIGVPIYMSPEMFTGESDQRSDVWAAGVILYRMLSGRLPFQSPTLTELLRETMQGRFAPIEVADADVGTQAAIHELLERLLAPSPDSRPSAGSACGMVHDLLRA
jgi:serine/threonine-protein kinase